MVVHIPDELTGADPSLGRLAPFLERLASLQEAWPPRLPQPVRSVVVREDDAGDLAAGMAQADEIADSGAGLLLLGGRGDPVPGLVAAATLLDLEPVRAVGTVAGPDWAATTVGVRDGLRRCRPHLGNAEGLVEAVGSPGFGRLVGLLAQSAVRRTPVLLDGSALVAGAALLAERVAPQASTWWLAGQAPVQPAARRALDDLGLVPLLDLGLSGPEGVGIAHAVLLEAVELARG